MTTFEGSVQERVDASPDQMFGVITDISRLPQWNRRIDHVVEAPDALGDDVEWVVQMRVNGARWNSRAHLEELDASAGRFRYVSRTDDNNPSRAHWSWQLVPADDGTEVTVSWELQPRTFFRERIAAPMRNRQLEREVRESIHAAASAAVQSQAD
jgi:hypothetical protein